MDLGISKLNHPIYLNQRCQEERIGDKGIHFLNRNFIRRYQDRILFGSDAIVSEPEKVQSALKFLERFLWSEEIFVKLVNGNYLTFHQASNRT